MRVDTTRGGCVQSSIMATKNKRPGRLVSEQLRKAIRDTGLSLNAVATGSGVSYGQLHRFYHGVRAITTPTVDRLCQYLRLELRDTGEKGD